MLPGEGVEGERNGKRKRINRSRRRRQGKEMGEEVEVDKEGKRKKDEIRGEREGEERTEGG